MTQEDRLRSQIKALEAQVKVNNQALRMLAAKALTSSDGVGERERRACEEIIAWVRAQEEEDARKERESEIAWGLRHPCGCKPRSSPTDQAERP